MGLVKIKVFCIAYILRLLLKQVLHMYINGIQESDDNNNKSFCAVLILDVLTVHFSYKTGCQYKVIKTQLSENI